MSKIEYLVTFFNKSFEHILYAGAGENCDLDILQQVGFNHLILLEADKEQVSQLKDKAASLSNIKVMNKALGIDSGQVIYNVASNPSFGSVLFPEKIISYYPSLEFQEQEHTDSVGISDLINEFKIKENKDNLLILDVNGLEGSIFNTSSNSLLKYFSAIVIRTSKDELYSSEILGFSGLTSKLNEQCLDFLVLPESSPPFVNIIINQANTKQFKSSSYCFEEKNQCLSESILGMETELQEIRKVVEETSAENAQLRVNKAQNEKAFSKQVKKLKKNLEKTISRYNQTQGLYSKLLGTSTDLKNHVDSQSLKIEQVQSENQALTAEKDKLSANLKQLQTANNELVELHKTFDAERVALVQQLTNQKGELTTKIQQLEDLVKEKGKLKTQTSSLQEVNAELAKQLSKQKAEQTTESQRLELRITNLESDLSERTKLCDEQAQELQQHKSRVENLVKEKEKLTAQTSSLEDEKAKLTQQLSKQKAKKTTEIQRFELRIANLESDLSERTKQRDEQLLWLQENKDWVESLKAEVEGLKVELAEKSRSVNLGQKMLAKAQIDLAELRDSYADKVQSEKELVELLRVLQEKLTLASKYYFKLQQEHPEILGKIEQSEGE